MNKNTRTTAIALAVLVLLAAVAGAWLALGRAPHRHELVQKTDAQGQVYYTCPMHPQVRQDAPGHCPICGMQLVRREDRPAGGSARASEERRVLYWYDPMRPDQHFDQPGKSPFMDMQLVPKYADAENASGGSVVEIDPRMVQRLGMRTAEIRAGTFWQRIDTVGSVAVDERRIVAVEARAAGWVEQLAVRAVGEPVKRGQVVASLYSPELMAAQEELALARKLGDATLIDAARTRLRLLGVSAGGTSQRAAIIAPQSGVVTELLVREGAQLTPGTPLMRIADLSQVWVVVEVPEAQAAWITAGKAAEARLRALPGRLFEGRVDYVYPMLDAQTRTLRARLVFDNADGALMPGMYADVTVYGGGRQEALLVPAEAVIRTGTRSVVIVAEAEGRYRPVAVTLGDERGDQIVVLGGLQPGQRVVVSGQFLIDSEASLQGAYQRLSPSPSPPTPLPQGERGAEPSPLAGEGGGERSEPPGEGAAP